MRTAAGTGVHEHVRVMTFPRQIQSALDATTVTVTVAVSEASIRVNVRDDGALGIPHMRPGDPEAEGKIFVIEAPSARRLLIGAALRRYREDLRGH